MTFRGLPDVPPAAIVEEASTAAAASTEFMLLARETLHLFETQRKALDAQIKVLDDRLAKLRLGLSVVEENSTRENGTDFRTRTTYHKDRTEVVTEARGADSAIAPSAPSIAHQDNIALFEKEQEGAKQVAAMARQAVGILNADLIEPMSLLDEAKRGNVVSIQVTRNQTVQYQLFSFKFDSVIGGLEGFNGLAKTFTKLVSACAKLAELTEYAKKWRSLLAPKTLWVIILPSERGDPVIIAGTSRRQFVIGVDKDAAATAHAHSIDFNKVEGLLVKRPGADAVRGLEKYLEFFPKIQDAWVYLCDEQQSEECVGLPILVYSRPAHAESVRLFAADRLEVDVEHSNSSPVFEFRLGERTIRVSDDAPGPEERGGDLAIAGADHCRLRDHRLDISQTPTLIELTPDGSGAIVRRWAP